MDSHSSLAVEASGLVKAFGTAWAVDGVDLARAHRLGGRLPRA
jgi:hypothetical protein